MRVVHVPERLGGVADRATLLRLTSRAKLAEAVLGRGRTACLRVAREANGKAANPFESVLRAISRDISGLDLRPQVVISEAGLVVRPGLVDESLRLVVEADSFEWHGKRKALKRDCERYNALVLLGWTVLRFSWARRSLFPRSSFPQAGRPAQPVRDV